MFFKRCTGKFEFENRTLFKTNHMYIKKPFQNQLKITYPKSFVHNTVLLCAFHPALLICVTPVSQTSNQQSTGFKYRKRKNCVWNMNNRYGLNDQLVQCIPPEDWKNARHRFKNDPHNLEGVVDFELALLGNTLSSSLLVHPDPDVIPVYNHAPFYSSSTPVYQGPLFGLKSRPGFVHAPRALSDSIQHVLGHIALTEYCVKPHVTNVDAHMHRPQNERPRISWASLGYHFDWTRRIYTEDSKSLFPAELQEITAAFARCLVEPTEFSYHGETAIVNYYKVNGSMGPHMDDSEDDTENPVVSITAGLSAIFLLGTLDKEDPPVPVLLRAGDVMMLSKESRLCFHGIATVLDHCVPSLYPELVNAHRDMYSLKEIPGHTHLRLSDNEEMESIKFLKTHRLNINARQVCIKGRTSLLTDSDVSG